MSRRLAGAALTVLAAFTVSVAPASAADSIYWGDVGADAIQLANLDGTAPASTLFGGEVDPSGIAIDAAANRIYWATGAGEIRVGNLDGSGSPATLFAGENQPRGIAVDPGAGRIYWASFGADAIRVGNIDGSGSAATLYSGETDAWGPIADPATGRLYWAQSVNPGQLRVGSLDGSGSATTLFANEASPRGIAIDSAAGKIYWANPIAPDPLRIGNLDGSGSPSDLFTDAGDPLGPAIDPAAGRIYWANLNNIRAANLDGSSAPSTLIGGATTGFLALLRSPAGAAAPAVSGGGSVGEQLACSQRGWANLPEASLYRAPRTFSYQWRKDGADIPGATEPAFTPSEPGEYTCRVTATNQAGSTAQTSPARTVSEPEPPPPGGPSLEITDVERNEQKGNAKLTVEFDPSGSLRVDKTNKVRGTDAVDVEGPGTAKLKIYARGKARKRLARHGHVTVNPRVLFDSPVGAIGRRVKFKLRADFPPGTVCLTCFRP